MLKTALSLILTSLKNNKSFLFERFKSLFLDAVFPLHFLTRRQLSLMILCIILIPFFDERNCCKLDRRLYLHSLDEVL